MSEVAIIGVGQTTYRRSHADKSSRELIWEAARAALDDAGLGIDAIEVVIAGVAPDAVTVDALARLQLAARHYGCRVRLRHASCQLLDLVAFMGLTDVLPG